MASKVSRAKKTSAVKSAPKKADLKRAVAKTPLKRAYVSQGEVPAYSLMQALRVPQAIADHYGFKPATPFNVAAALGVHPTSSTFRQLSGASIAYGLTKGGYNAGEIAIEPLGMRIVRPTLEGDDLVAKREALVQPRVIRDFLNRYNNAPLPRDDIARNVLSDLGVPTERSESVLEMIKEGAESLGIFRSIKGKRYVDLAGAMPAKAEPDDHDLPEEGGDYPATREDRPRLEAVEEKPKHQDVASRRVFITHGKNRAFIDPIKKLLGFGEMEPVVSVDRISVSQPVPDKVT
ncbi:hypothetical protein [Xanthomonas hortorum]|uniref:CD-NTase-associated protein 12/Pycsar effector protein TIR domain-containing protein n=1 Tax=Xanthomonas hortorum TaxID=56454 RepID=A0AA47EU31_9XANT|nr:hypothetical protein [Xanthomonas hortorum]WAH64170.1 hypothetical protein OEG85_22665 [Xanthomonas hortorum]